MPFAVLIVVALLVGLLVYLAASRYPPASPVGDRRARDRCERRCRGRARPHDRSAIPRWRGSCAAGSTPRRRPASRSPSLSAPPSSAASSSACSPT